MTRYSYVIPCYYDEDDHLQALICQKRVLHRQGLAQITQRVEAKQAWLREKYASQSPTLFHYIEPTLEVKKLIDRSQHRRFFGALNNRAGKLSAIGGRVDGGEAFVAAAVRELDEETGYSCQEHDLIEVASMIDATHDWQSCFYLLPLLKEEANDLKQNFSAKDNDEIAAIVSLPIGELAQVLKHGYINNNPVITTQQVQENLSDRWRYQNSNIRTLFVNTLTAAANAENTTYPEEFGPLVVSLENEMADWEAGQQINFVQSP